jgi:predicted aspartyl protease
MMAWRRRTWLGAAALAPLGLASRPSRAFDKGSSPLLLLPTGDLGALAATEARLGGRTWRCLIDSGASRAVVSRRVADELGLPVTGRSRVATAGGTMQLDLVRMPSVELASLSLAVGEALVLDLESAFGDAAVGIEGLIGAPALRPVAMRIDFTAQRIEWSIEPMAVPAASASHALWPLRWDGALPVIELVLGEREAAPFLLDTGNAGAIVVFARHAQRLGVDGLPRIKMLELGGSVLAHQALVERLAAPGYLTRDVPAAFEAGGSARRGAHFDRLAGSAGLALFAAGAVTIDGPRSRVVVEQPGLPDAAALPGGFGFALRSQLGAGPAVSAVFEGGPAERAGVRPGQTLRRLDARELAGARSAEVWGALRGVESARFEFEELDAPLVLLRERFFARWR